MDIINSRLFLKGLSISKYIKADQFFYPHGVRRGGYLELIDGKFGKHVDQVSEGSEMTIVVIVLHLSVGYTYSWI